MQTDSPCCPFLLSAIGFLHGYTTRTFPKLTFCADQRLANGLDRFLPASDTLLLVPFAFAALWHLLVILQGCSGKATVAPLLVKTRDGSRPAPFDFRQSLNLEPQ